MKKLSSSRRQRIEESWQITQGDPRDAQHDSQGRAVSCNLPKISIYRQFNVSYTVTFFTCIHSEVFMVINRLIVFVMVGGHRKALQVFPGVVGHQKLPSKQRGILADVNH